MFRFLLDLLRKIENIELTFNDWILAFSAIIFVRIFIENFSNIPFTGYWTSDASTIVHYYLYYLAAALSAILILSAFIPRAKLERVVLFALVGNWFAPIFDLLVSGGRGYFQHYIMADGAGLLKNFFMFFAPVAIPGITSGMRIGMIVGAIVVLSYVIYSTKSVIKGVLAAALVYAASFFWGALPSFVKIAHDLVALGGERAQAVGDFFFASVKPSLISQDFLHPAVNLSYARGLEVFFNVAMSQIYYILISILIIIYMFFHHRKKFLALLENSRQLRAAHYYLMIVFGIFVGLEYAGAAIPWNWLGVVSLAVLFLGAFSARAYAGGVNDVEDLAIDKVSSPGRPLPSGRLGERDLKNANLFFLVWTLLGGFLLGQYALFAVAATLFASHAYSVPPLRLRNYPMIATFLIALASFAAFAAGFYFVSPDRTTRALPMAYALIIILTLTLGENVKDIKDIEGDRRAGVYTIPVIFGEKNGRRIVGAMLAAAFLVAPLFLRWEPFFPLSLVAALAGYIFVNRNPYSEKSVLLTCSLYAGAVLLLFIMYGIPHP